MNLESVLRHLDNPDSREALAPGWDESAGTLPAAPPFLDSEQVLRSRALCGLGPEYDAPLLAAARQVSAEPPLRLLAWHAYRHAYVTPNQTNFSRWPSLERALCVPTGFFYLLIALAAVPPTLERFRAMGVSEEIACATLADIVKKCERSQLGRDYLFGMYPSELSWMQHHVTGSVFTLGRFEYKFGTYQGCCCEVYRHAETGATAAVATAGTRFTDDGFIDAEPAEGEGWTSERRDDADTIVGTPISPLGMALREEVHLPRAVWQRVLGPGDTILEIHIPGGGAMTPEACRESLRHAVSFFREHFPERPFTAFTCVSWIANDALPRMLPPASNLVRFQAETYLFPWPSRHADGFHFFFGHRPFVVASAPRDTSLQRAVLDYLASGGRWRIGGLFYLVDDLPRYGTHCYRAEWTTPVSVGKARI